MIGNDCNISKDIMQSGKPVLWTMAGRLERLSKTCNSRHFSEIKCLALVYEDKEGGKTDDAGSSRARQDCIIQ